MMKERHHQIKSISFFHSFTGKGEKMKQSRVGRDEKILCPVIYMRNGFIFSPKLEDCFDYFRVASQNDDVNSLTKIINQQLETLRPILSTGQQS